MPRRRSTRGTPFGMIAMAPAPPLTLMALPGLLVAALIGVNVP